MSLDSIADPASGAALLRALDTISWPNAAEQAAEALGRIRYELAALAVNLPREGEIAFIAVPWAGGTVLQQARDDWAGIKEGKQAVKVTRLSCISVAIGNSPAG
jgi:hypothetical protein